MDRSWSDDLKKRKALFFGLWAAPLACALLGAQEPKDPAPPGAGGSSVKLIAYDGGGHAMDLPKFLAFIGRADRKNPPDPAEAGIFAASPEGLAAAKPELKQSGALLTLRWEGLARIALSLPWPVAEDGFSTVWADKGGAGFSDGDVLYLNEEIALAQHRFFKEAWLKHTKDMDPAYQPGAKAKKLQARAQELMAEAQGLKEGAKRAAGFDKALKETALAWEKMLFEHGLQIAGHERFRKTLRFGLTLDESLLNRLDHYPWIIEAVKRSGANWVRLVFRSNPSDFAYAKRSSFNEYDAIVKDLRTQGLRVMGSILDTAQWPSNLTPELYAERTKNIVFHYHDQIRSWELGSELNGDWLGGIKTPLAPEKVFKIYSAAAARVKEIEPALETVATLYWWDGTAPDEEHSLFGWLSRYVPLGFGKDLDVAALSLQPEDSPVGLAFERIFERVHQFLPDKKLMLGSFGYVEGKDLKGYWWLDPSDVESARKDLAILYTTASCGVERSLCGGFWWQTLEQMLPSKRKTTDLFRVYERTLRQLGR